MKSLSERRRLSTTLFESDQQQESLESETESVSNKRCAVT